MVIDSPSLLNEAMMHFVILSSAGPLTVNPPSWYSLSYFLPIQLHILSRRYKLNSSQILAPSKIPIVMSSNVSSPFLTQVPFFKKSSDCLVIFIVLTELSSSFVKDLAYLIDFSKRFCKMEG